MMNRYRRSTDFRLEEIDGELVLFDPGSAAILYCNPTAGMIWRLCDGSRTRDDIVNMLSEAYPESAESINTDVDEALALYLKYNALATA